jgi:hypothetical protein
LTLTLLPVVGAAGQTVNDMSGAVIGRVTDASASALPGVTVVISSPRLMGTQRTSTSAAGDYRFPLLPPGEYTLVFTRAGFATLTRRAIQVTLGVTTTINVAMDVARIETHVTIHGATPVLDRKSPSVVVSFDAAQLANLPGTRSMGTVLSATPAVLLARFDVGGSAGLISPPFSAYGTTGQAQPMLEGVVMFQINPFGLTLDYGSVQDVSVMSAASGPDARTTGLRVQFITKSGCYRYQSSLYTDYGDRRWQAFNIDQNQIDRTQASGSLSRDDNRLWSYRDFNADVGGYVKKDRLWWYASSRVQAVSARLVAFPVVPVEPYRTEVWNVTVKGTYRVNNRHSLVVFANVTHNHEPNLLDAFRPAGGMSSQTSAIHSFTDSTSKRLASGSIAKVEWQWTVGNSLFAEVRVGRFAPRREEIPNGSARRFENVTTSEVRGGNRNFEVISRQPQLQASATYFRNGWFGRHQVKIGAEIMRWTEIQSWRQAYPGDVLHAVRDDQFGQTRPFDVYLFSTPSRAESGLWFYSGHVNDTWQMHAKLSLSLGLRFDRFRAFLPEQAHPFGPVTPATRIFPAVNNLIDWNVLSPRVGVAYDVTGDGRTLAKASYGRFAVGPGTELGFNANPNSNQPWTQYRWVDDNDDGLWQPGEQKGEPINPRGLEKVDSTLKLPYTREVAVSLERELSGGVALRSGLVWRGLRQPFARQDDNRPGSAYSVATVVHDPGPDRVPGNDDDGGDITVYALPSGLPAANIFVRNVPNARVDHWTWEITAMKRSRGRWSLVAGFAHTWSRDHAREYSGQLIRQNPFPLTPNDLINTGEDGRHEFTIWSARIHGTYEMPWGVRVAPFLRHQGGQPFGRTLEGVVPGVNRILAEPIGTRRMDHLTSLDLRIDKRFALPARGRVAVFIDVFNLFNANPEQNISWVSGSSFLRPLTIVPPRIARLGVKVDW